MFIMVLSSKSSTSGGFREGVISEVLPESQRPEFKCVLNSIFCMIAFSAHIGENCGII
jgi:hypothetical protein